MRECVCVWHGILRGQYVGGARIQICACITDDGRIMCVCVHGPGVRGWAFNSEEANLGDFISNSSPASDKRDREPSQWNCAVFLFRVARFFIAQKMLRTKMAINTHAHTQSITSKMVPGKIKHEIYSVLNNVFRRLINPTSIYNNKHNRNYSVNQYHILRIVLFFGSLSYTYVL